MPANERTDAQIREEISQERIELSHAVDDLREDARAAGRIVLKVGGAILAAAVTAAVVRQIKN